MAPRRRRNELAELLNDARNMGVDIFDPAAGPATDRQESPDPFRRVTRKSARRKESNNPEAPAPQGRKAVSKPRAMGRKTGKKGSKVDRKRKAPTTNDDTGSETGPKDQQEAPKPSARAPRKRAPKRRKSEDDEDEVDDSKNRRLDQKQLPKPDMKRPGKRGRSEDGESHDQEARDNAPSGSPPKKPRLDEETMASGHLLSATTPELPYVPTEKSGDRPTTPLAEPETPLSNAKSPTSRVETPATHLEKPPGTAPTSPIVPKTPSPVRKVELQRSSAGPPVIKSPVQSPARSPRKTPGNLETECQASAPVTSFLRSPEAQPALQEYPDPPELSPIPSVPDGAPALEPGLIDIDYLDHDDPWVLYDVESDAEIDDVAGFDEGMESDEVDTGSPDWATARDKLRLHRTGANRPLLALPSN
ncbi:hypothetical protein VTK73DRAFT_4585 [Phialemonium thermophilum]|uniref:Uncharacterized protein n=1 Tax=Phialemonium thermophilum TaxID=223376 RepID=A0ABR3XYQ0_9PEZI